MPALLSGSPSVNVSVVSPRDVPLSINAIISNPFEIWVFLWMSPLKYFFFRIRSLCNWNMPGTHRSSLHTDWMINLADLGPSSFLVLGKSRCFDSPSVGWRLAWEKSKKACVISVSVPWWSSLLGGLLGRTAINWTAQLTSTIRLWSSEGIVFLSRRELHFSF